MSKLYFIYAPMSSGKSAQLIMKAHSFQENNIPVLCIKPSIDNRDSSDKISSRIGISQRCLSFNDSDDIYSVIEEYCSTLEGLMQPIPRWILCDEAQFLTEAQIDQLSKVVDELDINVMCYGLRNDFTGHLFPGTKRLFELADNIEEMKLSCKCGNKAIINARFDNYGNIITSGNQIEIGGNDMYKPMCRKCFFENIKDSKIYGKK